jgi:hypothetical protein
MLGWILFFAGLTWTFGFIISWYLRTRKSAKHDLPMPDVNYRLSRIRRRIFLVCAASSLFCFLAGIISVVSMFGGLPNIVLPFLMTQFISLGIAFWFRRQVNTKKRKRKTNILLFIITIIIMEAILFGGMFITFRGMLFTSFNLKSDSIGNRPVLVLNDTVSTDESDGIYISPMIMSSIAVPVHYKYWESGQPVATEVYHSISKVLSRSLYNRQAEKFKKDYDERNTQHELWEIPLHYDIICFTPAEAAFWGAEKGVALFHEYDDTNSFELLLLNGKTILRLSFTGENMDMETANQAVHKLWNDLDIYLN